MSRSTTYVSIKGTVVKETDKAVLFNIEELSTGPLETPIKRWIPLSQCEKRVTDPSTSGNDTMMVTEWIYDKVIST